MSWHNPEELSLNDNPHLNVLEIFMQIVHRYGRDRDPKLCKQRIVDYWM